MLVSILLSCSSQHYKEDQKIFAQETLQLYSLAVPLTLEELKLMKLDTVEFKKLRNLRHEKV